MGRRVDGRADTWSQQHSKRQRPGHHCPSALDPLHRPSRLTTHCVYPLVADLAQQWWFRHDSLEPTVAVLSFFPPLLLFWYLDLFCPWAKKWRVNESDDMTQWKPAQNKLDLKVAMHCGPALRLRPRLDPALMHPHLVANLCPCSRLCPANARDAQRMDHPLGVLPAAAPLRLAVPAPKAAGGFRADSRRLPTLHYLDPQPAHLL